MNSSISQDNTPLQVLFKEQLPKSDALIVTNLNTNNRPVSPFYTFKLSEHEFTFSEFSDTHRHVTQFFFDREQWQYDGQEMDESLIQTSLAKIQKVYRDIHNQKVTILENRKENISEIITTNHEDKEKVDHTIEQIIRGNIHIHSLSAQELEKIAGGAGLSVNDLSLLIQRTIGERPKSNIVQLLSDKKVIGADGQHRIYKATKQQQLFLIKWLSTFIGKYSVRKALKKEGTEKAFEKALQYGGTQIHQTETQTKIGSLIKLKGEDIFIGGRKVDSKQLMQKIDVYYTGIENAYFELSDQDQLTQNGQKVLIYGNLLDGTIKDVNNRTIATIKNGVLLDIDNPKLLEGLIYILLTQRPETLKDVQVLLKTDNREFLCAYNNVLQLRAPLPESLESHEAFTINELEKGYIEIIKSTASFRTAMTYLAELKDPNAIEAALKILDAEKLIQLDPSLDDYKSVLALIVRLRQDDQIDQYLIEDGLLNANAFLEFFVEKDVDNQFFSGLSQTDFGSLKDSMEKIEVIGCIASQMILKPDFSMSDFHQLINKLYKENLLNFAIFHTLRLSFIRMICLEREADPDLHALSTEASLIPNNDKLSRFLMISDMMSKFCDANSDEISAWAEFTEESIAQLPPSAVEIIQRAAEQYESIHGNSQPNREVLSEICFALDQIIDRPYLDKLLLFEGVIKKRRQDIASLLINIRLPELSPEEPLDPAVDLVGINEADSISEAPLSVSASEKAQLVVSAFSKLDLDHFKPEMNIPIVDLLKKAQTLFDELDPEGRKELFQAINQQLKRIDHAFNQETIAKSFDTLVKAYSNSVELNLDHKGVYTPSGKKQKALYHLTKKKSIEFENFADLQNQLIKLLDPHHPYTIRLAKSILLDVLKARQKEVLPHSRLLKKMGDIISQAEWKPIERYVPIIHTNDQGEQTFLIQKSTILPANAHFQKSLDPNNSILEDHTFLDYEQTGVSCLAQDTAHRAVNLAKTVYQDKSGHTLYSGFRSGVMDAYMITPDYWLSLSDDEKLETAKSFLDLTYRLEPGLLPDEFRNLLNQYLDQAEPLSKKELHALIDYMRSAANFIRAEETLKAAALNKLLDPDYLSPLEREGAIQNAEFAIRFSHSDLEETSQTQPIPLHFLSTALVTPDIWRKGLHGERKMLQNQMRALEAFHGKTISISIKDKSGQPKEVHFKVDIYAFNFGVNEGALGQRGPLGWMAHSWEASDHYNTLAVSRLEARVKAYLSAHPSTDNRHIIEKLFQQIQDIWNQKDYRYQESDPYKMPKRLLYLAYLMGDVGHFNCKSGKDRTGMLDVEVKHFAQEIQMLKLDHPGSTDWELPSYKAGGRLNTRSLLSEESSYQLAQLALLGGNLRMHEYNTHLRGYKLKDSPLVALRNRLGSKETWNDVLGLSQFAKS